MQYVHGCINADWNETILIVVLAWPVKLVWVDDGHAALVSCEFVATRLLRLLLLDASLVNHSHTGSFRHRPNVSRIELRQRILFRAQPRLVARPMPALPRFIPAASFPQPTHYLHRTFVSSNNNNEQELIRRWDGERELFLQQHCTCRLYIVHASANVHWTDFLISTINIC